MVRYLTEEGQVDLLSSQLAACQCYQVALDFGHPTSEEARLKSLNTNDGLQQNKDIFAWTHSDMFGIPPSIASQSLMSHPPRILSNKRFHVSIWIDQIIDAIVRYGMLSFLNNAGATYQRLMMKIFKPLIDRTMEHLEETFRLMQAYNMKFNLAKCVFGVSAGKFLGGASMFSWTNECRQAFEVVKRYLTELSILIELPQKPAHLVESLREQWWTLHVDGASRASSSGISLILESPTEELVDNEAKYEAILVGLDLAITLATTRLEIRSDSQLIFGQIQKEYEANDECMACYLTMKSSNATHLPPSHTLNHTRTTTQKKFMLVAIDYFNKWAETEAYASIKDKDVSKFVWKNIMCQFEVP
ncbi:hypothetical protein AAG906_013805 [Vitis piasezkii]